MQSNLIHFVFFLTPVDSFPVSQFMTNELITNFIKSGVADNLYFNGFYTAEHFLTDYSTSLIEVSNVFNPSSFNVKTYNYDRNFPSLFLVPQEDSFIYEDYINKKAALMGFLHDETQFLPYRPVEFEPESPRLPTNHSNLLTLRGKTTDVSKLTPAEDIMFLQELPWDRMDEYLSLECVRTQSQASTPTRKLHYPEPFIASASFVHTDIAFIHILHYNYWLWFVFVFLIVFFFLTFLCTIRWCNMRTRPRRETRGISRSKCGDLITACVPVSWAASIIISESTDTSGFYDGFSAPKIMVGIQDYQWGWEYYYPKSVDLNYAIKPSHSRFIGNSLKYVDFEEGVLVTNNLWKFYQNKETDLIVTPAHLLLLPLDHKKVLNFFNFKPIICDNFRESFAFKRTTTSSKTFNSNLVTLLTSFVRKDEQVSQLHSSKTSSNLSHNYGIVRQYNTLNLEGTTFQSNIRIQLPLFDEMVGLIRHKIPSSQPISRFISCYITKPIFGTRIAEAAGSDSTIWIVIALYILNPFSKAESSGVSNDNQGAIYNSWEDGTTSSVTESESNKENTNYTKLHTIFWPRFISHFFPASNFFWLLNEKLRAEYLKAENLKAENLRRSAQWKQRGIEALKAHENVKFNSDGTGKSESDRVKKAQLDRIEDFKLDDLLWLQLYREDHLVAADISITFLEETLDQAVNHEIRLDDDFFRVLMQWNKEVLNGEKLPYIDRMSRKIVSNNLLISRSGKNLRTWVERWEGKKKKMDCLFETFVPAQKQQDYQTLEDSNIKQLNYDSRIEYLRSWIDYYVELEAHSQECLNVVTRQQACGRKHKIQNLEEVEYDL